MTVCEYACYRSRLNVIVKIGLGDMGAAAKAKGHR
jgi:hypothetical protein